MAIHQHIPLLLFLGAAGVSGLAPRRASPLIKLTCAAATKYTWKTLYHYCVHMLSADPRATFAADARGLAVVAASLTAANVTSTVRALRDLVGSIQQCLDMYRDMNGWVVGAVDDLRAGRVEAAWLALKDASYQPGYCELALMEGNSTPKDPVSDGNNASDWMSAMAADIAETLHDHRAGSP
uniref:Pectinesterase inhibitor domain-containing protein n=1 Tax=Triticum urartu TaxID=4572 RepID=A0A8R7TR95_TRIUA